MGDEYCTPGVVTSWYRDPRICAKKPYGKKSDIWSAGCVIYELVCGKALLKGTKDDDIHIFNAAVAKLPKQPKRNVMKKLFEDNEELKTKYKPTIESRQTYVSRMKLSAKIRREFEAVPGSLDELEDLLESMLCLDSDERISASRALNHPFFDWTREHIETVRKEYPPEPPPLPFYEIYPCIERRWVAALAFNIYNKNVTRSYRVDMTYPGVMEVEDEYLTDSCLKWYSNRVLFHAIDLFDQYINYRLEQEDTLRMEETEILGRIHTIRETYLYFYCCLYIMHKYHATLEIPRDWDVFTPDIFHNAKDKKDAISFEELIVNNVVQFEIFRKTLLEISNEFKTHLTDDHVRDLLFKLGTMDEVWTDRSVRALYRHFNDIPSPTSKKIKMHEKK